MFGADFGTWTIYSRKVKSKFLQKLSGRKICSVPYGTKMTKAITKWEMYKIYWSIFDLSVLYLRMVLTVRSKQNNHDYTKMKTKNKQTRGLKEPIRFFWRLQLFSVKQIFPWIRASSFSRSLISSEDDRSRFNRLAGVISSSFSGFSRSSHDNLTRILRQTEYFHTTVFIRISAQPRISAHLE